MECSVNHANLKVKFCPSCGANIANQSTQQNPSYGNTGVSQQQAPIPPVQHYTPAAPSPKQTTNTLAVIGFVTSILCCGSAVGIVCSAIALGQLKKNPSQGGKGLATAGLVIGIVGTVGAIFYWIFTAIGSSGY